MKHIDLLPTNAEEMQRRGWSRLDIVLITGDAYVDHPSFGVSLIGRYLESLGYRVGIIAQPDWKNVQDFKRLGRPRLFFGITAGNVDSMIANYTANKRPRSDDDYSPGGRAGNRPDRAVTVYANRVREAYKDVAVVIGGIEASLRRLAHYDYWDDKVRRSILLDTRADILVYGMGERQIAEIARRLETGETLDGIAGTAQVLSDISGLTQPVMLPSHEEVAADPEAFNHAFKLAYREMDPYRGKVVVQPHANRYVVEYPPARPLTSDELDRLYVLPYACAWHPSYTQAGGVKGLETVRFSLTSHRGCSGECAFCALYLHQGRIVQSRSADSIVREAETMAARPDFKGTITDVGGPTVNMYGAKCRRWEREGTCRDKKCLVPEVCAGYNVAYRTMIDLYRRIRQIPRVKHVFVGSGLRFDLLKGTQGDAYLEELCRHHISGLLKVAPEHCADEVLVLMNKPRFAVYEEFMNKFRAACKAVGKKLFVVNYFISAHPGCSLRETLKMALYLVKRGVRPEQIQDFIPAPMTVSTCMYHTGKHPFTGKTVHVPRAFRERKMHRALIQYDKPANRDLIVEALKSLNALHVLSKFTQAGRNRREKV